MKLTTLMLTFALAAAELSAQTNSSNPGKSKEDISRIAGQMLDCTNKARQALKQGDHQAAIKDVAQAQNYAYQVRSMAPHATMVPVYQEFVSVSILGPVKEEQKAHKAGTAVKEVAGDYTQVMVSSAVSSRYLEAAKNDLAKGNWTAADAALAGVQDGVEMESVESDMPLARTRENLILARAAVQNSHFNEAQASLQAASKALANYAAENTSHKQQAENLKQQINQLASSIQQNHSDAVAKINGWWNTTSEWSPYQTAQTYAKR